MIILYDTTETKFTSNGLGVLDHDIINPVVEESANGTFKLSFDYPLSGICGSRIGRRMYVKADDPDTEGNIFKIYNIEKSDGMLSIIAFQVANEFNNNWVEHTNIMGKNGQSALDQMKSNLTNSTRFNFYSDITNTANSEIVRLNPLTWLIDSSTDNSFVNRWGGEIKRDGFNIRMFKQRGSNNGVQIRWRKNLSSYNVKWDDTTVVTRIRPVGYNGLTLPELYVDSPKLANYGDPIIKEVKYESVKVADENSSSDDNVYATEDEAYTALRELAAKEFSENHLDDPTVTADVSMISLKNTREYADVAELETIRQWDTIQLINERDNIDIQMRLNSYKYNPLNHEFTELKFVSVNQSLTSGNTSLSSVINGISSTVQSVSDVANQAQIAANGKNMIQRGDANPNNLTFNGTLTDGDIYWRKNGDKTEMWIYNAKDKAWGLVVDDATGIKADEAQATADGKNTISYADTAPANPKVNDVWFEEKSDGTIITNIWNGTKWESPTSSEVKKTQVDLESKISEAQADANKKIADTQSNLDKVEQDSNKLISDAQAELNTQADELKTVKQNAEDALNKSNGNSSSITDINADISKINGSLTIKANKSDIDAVNKTVSSQQNQITANTEGLQLKADKTSVDTLSQTVTSQSSQLSVLNDEVAEKTNKTDFDNLTGRVTSAEQKVTANADGLNSTVSKMSTLQDQVNNSAVGTNLLTNSSLYSNVSGWSASSAPLSNGSYTIINKTAVTSSRYLLSQLLSTSSLTVGSKYTFSIYVYIASGSTTVNNQTDIRIRETKSDGSAQDFALKNIDLTKTGQWQRVVTTGVVPSDSVTNYMVLLGVQNDFIGSIYINCAKLEKGSTATDYSANPADNATVTSVTNVSQKADQIAADLATSNGDITQLKAKATGWDSSIASANGKINTLQATSDGYAVNISTLQDQVNNSAVGTNLLTNSSGRFQPSGNRIDNWSSYSSFINLTKGTTYTLSATTNGVFTATHDNTKESSNATIWLISSSTNDVISSSTTGTTGTTFTWGRDTGKYQLRINGYHADNSTWVEKVKIELGSHATDYSTNPTDNATTNYVDTQITATAGTLSANLTSATTTLKTYADNSANNAKNSAISTASSDATTKANNAQNNAIATAKTYADTQISATAGTFNVKTSSIQTQLDNSAVGTNLLLGTSRSASLVGNNTNNQTMYAYLLANGYNVNQLVTRYGGTFTISFDWAVSSSSPSGNLTVQWNNVPWGLGSFATVSSSNTSGHAVKTFSTSANTANIATMIGFRGDNLVGTLTVSNLKLEVGSNSTDWSLAPTDTDYTNLFSMDSNGITLDAHGVNNSNKTILLRGDHVKIDSSNPVIIPSVNANVITSGTLDASKITVNKLSANSITSGTLNAANVNVINLNANNITSGTLNGVTFHQKSSDMETWVDNNGIHNISGSSNVWIKNGDISAYDSSGQGMFMDSGALYLTTYNLWENGGRGGTPQYGSIGVNSDLFSNGGIAINGNNGYAIRTQNSDIDDLAANPWTSGRPNGSFIGGKSDGTTMMIGHGTSFISGGTRYGEAVYNLPCMAFISVGSRQDKSGAINGGDGGDIWMEGYQINIQSDNQDISLSAQGNVNITRGGFIATAAGSHIRNTQIDNELWVNGTLNVSGAKNAIVKTSKGWAQINAYETAEYYFGDLGKTNTGSGSKVKIVMDSLFLETVNTNVDYHVFLSSYGNGYAWVSEQTETYFVIESNVPNLQIGYEIKAKRLGYENNRLEIDKDFEDKFETEKRA
ncbi:phage tail spike protein [Liquorilactobacillus hordei]|uniref:phage tail spike protein n=1 Tax=Liquorilactobacillus hordei TaxID=468911 RepID=UPI0039ECB45D